MNIVLFKLDIFFMWNQMDNGLQWKIIIKIMVSQSEKNEYGEKVSCER